MCQFHGVPYKKSACTRQRPSKLRTLSSLGSPLDNPAPLLFQTGVKRGGGGSLSSIDKSARTLAQVSNRVEGNPLRGGSNKNGRQHCTVHSMTFGVRSSEYVLGIPRPLFLSFLSGSRGGGGGGIGGLRIVPFIFQSSRNTAGLCALVGFCAKNVRI